MDPIRPYWTIGAVSAAAGRKTGVFVLAAGTLCASGIPAVVIRLIAVLADAVLDAAVALSKAVASVPTKSCWVVDGGGVVRKHRAHRVCWHIKFK